MSSNSRFVPLVLKTDTEPNMNKNLISAACKSLSLLIVFALLNITSYAQEISKESGRHLGGRGII